MIIRAAKSRESTDQKSKPLVSAPILIVEDQKSSSDILRQKIKERWEVEIHIASTYAEAKDYLKKYRQDYSLAICDLNLPDSPNGEILHLMEVAHVKCIALTGAASLESAVDPYSEYMVDFISKETFDSYDYVVGLVGRLHRNKRYDVLMVEDSNTAAMVLKKMLKLLNFNVYKASNGKEALDVLEQNPNIRIVISDYEMPEMDGFQFTVNARRRWDKDQLVIIGVSASGQNGLGAKFIKYGANDFLFKPYSFEELMCRIHMNIEALEHLDFVNEIANKDHLTKLYNRRYFFAKGKEIHQHCGAVKKPLVFAMIDVDFFKKVNDTYGHDAGDAVLRYFSQQMSAHFDGHLVARLGGEEFAIVLVGLSSAQALTLAEEFRQTIESAQIDWTSHQIKITVSIGLNAQYSDNIDAMLQIADKNVYTAKKEGRNRVISS